MHQMNDAWTDPSAMSEPVLAIGDMKGDESLGKKNHEEDVRMMKNDTT